MTETIQEQILDGVQKLAEAMNEHRRAAREHAEAEHAYRQLRASEFVKASLKTDDNGKKLTDTHKNAIVDLATDKAMFRIRIAEAEHEAASELIKSLRAQISALQSLLNALKAEAEAVTYRQTMGA
jgi:hypothetical protein